MYRKRNPFITDAGPEALMTSLKIPTVTEVAKPTIEALTPVVAKRRPKMNSKKYKKASEEGGSSSAASAAAAAAAQEEKKTPLKPLQTKIESPTSDYGDELIDPSDDPYLNDLKIYNPLVRKPTNFVSIVWETFSSSFQLHTKEKPPFSFSTLIFMAIEASKAKALPVKDIYTWILDHYPYFKTAPTGWKNSVRHNLSLNKCFCKVDNKSPVRKGNHN